MRIYYTYKWVREDGTPYYIGKGKGNRAWVVHKRKKVSYYPPEGRVHIIMDGLTEEEALLHEVWLIALYKRKSEGGVLINITEGGKGPTGAKWKLNEEAINRRKNRPPRKFSPKACENISKGKAGKPHAPHTSEAKRKIGEGNRNPSLEKRKRQSEGVTRTNSIQKTCPDCGKTMNVGNLAQHIRRGKCNLKNHAKL